ncbi:HAD family hydrolase [Streptomyces sp. NPDC101132]|uniref:HAD family hydrolase n=1 Tax=Streptomyces sp. NPDC101132 TaxID=3366110 RepID=UPI00380798F1
MTAGPPAGAFDAVLCDLDGVIRFYDEDGIGAMERAAGLPEGTTAAVAFSPEVDLPLLLGRITREEWTDAIARHVPAELARAFAYAPSRIDPEVVALLRASRAVRPLVLVTNATPWLREDLAALGIDDLAHAVVSSAEVGVAKPDPEIYTIALERAGVPAGRCLFVDDREENVEAAVRAGMTGLHYREPADLARLLG